MRSTALFFFAVIAGTAAVLVPGLFTGIAARGNGVAVRMVVWGMPFEDRLFDDIYARRHEELNPHITVDYQRHSDVLSKYNAWHSAGEGAEVMRIGIDYYQQFIERGILEPLDEYINMPEPYGLSSEEMAAFPGDLMRELRYEGKLYGL
ncbi:MAG: hypothetical protein MI741_22860, partial [Rhodospirillales bacterium]|nr:hypothetical protein [Rhodospirillales bacterium]